ncbi:gag-polyprotein putative aspartyl protease [Daejeonella rubra]|uniref:Gag-polyprotein putative aspartyl protease n=1 Tax=Daejeonella rubra TaxID=990371 RepID=A0A1G9R743_9SPHI|nr:retroviral-like aspartic protease family protein [Daejeonella rubra]SDM19043.1 gag-polyprotein putative aspartyl protease [Daejeonella rubra]
MQKYLFALFFFLLSLDSSAQSKRIDTIPFTLDKLLLVFKGTVNGVEADFAFDTGAAITVSNSKSDMAFSIREKGGKKGITDANQNVTKLQNIVFDDLGVGSHHITKVKGVSADMPYLYCANLVLLGQDFIKKFNWKIDFDQNLIFLSEAPFVSTDKMQTWPIFYRGNRPYVNFKLNNTNYTDCLIDMGFNGVFDIHIANPDGQLILAEKKKLNKVNPYITASMGLHGLNKAAEKSNFLLDSVRFTNVAYHQVLASISEAAETKLGIKFFRNFSRIAILNHSESKYYLLPRETHEPYIPALDARLSMKNGKFTVSDIYTGINSSASPLQIGDVILSVNGKIPADFKDDCDFLLWMYQYKNSELTIKKIDGIEILIKRGDLLL